MHILNCRTSTRIGYATFLLLYVLACMVINQGYECNLKSHLTTIIPPDPVDSFEELAEFPFGNLFFVSTFVDDLNAILQTSSDTGRDGLEKLGAIKRVDSPPKYIKVLSDTYSIWK